MAEKSKSLSKNGIYYLIYNVLNIAFPFLTGIYVARILLPVNIGEVTAAQNVSTYFFILAFLGIPTYGLREIAKVRNDEAERSKIFSELYTINLISTIFFYTVYLAVIFIVPQYRENLPLFLIVGSSIALNAFNISWLYEAMEEFRFISIRNLVFKIFSFACLVIFVRKPEDYMKYAVITVVGTVGNYAVNMFYMPRFARLSFRDLNLKRHMKPILYLVAVNLAIELYSLVDVTMMNFLSSKESIAYYKYGLSIQKMLLQIVNTFTMVLVPRISFYFKEKKIREFNLLVSKGMKLIIIFALPAIVGILFTSDFLICQMYGDQYINSAAVLKMLSLLLLISPIGYLLGSRMLLVTDHESKMIICVGAGAVVNLIGNALMIPHLHEFGAAAASVISEIVVMVVYVSFGRKYFRLINVGETAWKVVAACAVMALYLYLCSVMTSGWLRLILQVVGAGAIYGSALVITKEETAIQYFNMGLGKLKSLIGK